MGKSTRTSILLAMAAAALLLMTLLDDSIWGLLVGSWALMFWGWSGTKPQEVTGDVSGLSVQDIKAYRVEHPGATIVDAVNALGKPKA
ncbi:hypothetical protein [Glutamicibacter arilaitensis]|uniref:hypothetical protein n=1 Tax=Glutamicibacter arilaitensis TaxID=256701 RepID=UPI000EB93848|nr:hypothetical protein [Glutamicibacter sp.]